MAFSCGSTPSLTSAPSVPSTYQRGLALHASDEVSTRASTPLAKWSTASAWDSTLMLSGSPEWKEAYTLVERRVDELEGLIDQMRA